MPLPRTIIVGVDVGGTFTDLVQIDPAAGTVEVAKVPTTPENQAFGVLAALDAAEIDPAAVAQLIHGTTVTTNALLERKVAATGLITTRGFRDVLELGRRTRPRAYGMTGHFEPLIPRERRLEVAERVDAAGDVLMALDEAGVAAAAVRLREMGCEAVVVHFLHAYANPAHEARAAAIVREVWPAAYVTAGHTILSEYREYERGVTAAVNAAVQPVLHRYLDRLTAELAARGYDRDLLIMQGNGGTVSARLIVAQAVKTVMSGPASGVMAAAEVARRAGLANVITYDMGGTSSDVGLVRGGVPEVSTELELEYAMPIHVPMVEVRTIGAGGGSIARVDEAGLLQVGPESAGARPGPIGYGRGGDRVTITDANLVLGRLDPARLLAVDSPVTLERVRAAVAEQIGAPLGLDVDEAAAAVVHMANTLMANAVRMVSLARGHDPRDFALFAFGGAGPLHAAALARELGIPRLAIPARPGITNAIGCALADIRHDFVNTLNTRVPELDMDAVRATLAVQVAEGRAAIERERVPVEAVTVLHRADMQFLGQSHILSVGLPDGAVSREALQALFEEAYWSRFAVRLPEIRAVLVNLHTAVIGRRPPFDLALLAGGGDRATTAAEAVRTRRPVFAGGRWADTPVYVRARLPLGVEIAGPAIVEQMDTTILIEPGDTARLDDIGNLRVDVAAGAGSLAA